MELYKQYAPKKLANVYGNENVVKQIQQRLEQDKFPTCSLFTGPSGCGKTTVARIVSTMLNCASIDLHELNCADARGIDTIRTMQRSSHLRAYSQSCVWILDEAHMLTKEAQNALLKVLEDSPAHNHYILATTDPAKLVKTIRTRCTEFRFAALTDAALAAAIARICKLTKRTITEDVREQIIRLAEGSGRAAIVALESVLMFNTEDEQTKCLDAMKGASPSVFIGKLLTNNKTTWAQIAAALKTLEEDPEQIRRGILGYASSIMLGSSTGWIKARAFLILEVFSDHTYDTGKPGLVRMCYEIFNQK